MDKDEIKILKDSIDKLNKSLDQSRIKEYVIITESKRKLFLINFISGLGKGLGYAVGFTFLSGILIYILASSVDLPIIGHYIAKLMDIVDTYRTK